MIPYKHKIKNSRQGVKYTTQGYEGYAFHIQAVFYTSQNANSHVNIYDKDGDLCVYPVPGQMMGSGDEPAKPATVDPITVMLPLSVIDETGGNDITIFGTIEKPAII